MSHSNEERDLQLNLLLEEILAKYRNTGVLDESTWRDLYPELAEELPGLLQTVRDLDTAAGDWHLHPAGTETLSHAPDSPDFETPAHEPFPKQMGRYQIQERLGAGGMGTVYKAYDPQLDREVALKVPRLEGPQRDRVAIQRFLREARSAAQIRHPHVCPIYDVGEDSGSPYVVMAYVPGSSLADRLKEAARFEDPRQAVELVVQIAQALEVVHRHGIIHRDLKPGNILLDSDGQAVLTDFGLAHSISDPQHLTAAGTLLGTPAYMAPEQAAGDTEKMGPWSDLYSLGVVLYQMLTGRLPYEGPLLAVLAKIHTEAPPPPSRFRDDLSPELESLVQKAMARRPEDRFASARDFAQALEHWLGKPSASVQEQLTVPEMSRPRSTPAVVQVALPGGDPVTISVDAGGITPDKLSVTVRERPGTRKRRRQLAITVTVTFSLLMGLALILHPGRPFPVSQTPDSQALAEREAQALAEREARLALQQAEQQRRAAENLRQLAMAHHFQFQHKLERVRRPRVRLTYDQENAAAQSKVELPFVIGVLADLSGHPKPPLPPLGKRRVLPIDRDNFDDVLRRASPRLQLQVANHLTGEPASLSVELAFKGFADFEPGAVMEQVPALKPLLEQRRALLKLGKERQKELAALDQQLSRQLAAIVHHPDFQRLESTWRGLHYLAYQSETGALFKIRVLNVKKEELAQDLQQADPTRSVLFQKVYTDEYCQLGGQPYTLLVGDQEFGRRVEDIDLLGKMAAIAARAQAPFLAAASPSLVGAEKFSPWHFERYRTEVGTGNAYAAWRVFRQSENARYVVLTLPRLLARLPHGASKQQGEAFTFDEVGPGGERRLLWMSAAWALAQRVGNAHAQHGWPALIWGEEGGGKIESLPGTAGMTGSRFVEVLLPDPHALELAGLGFLAVKQSPKGDAFFPAAPSCRNAGPWWQLEENTERDPLARLDVMLCVTRFAQYLKVLSGQKLRSFFEIKDCERWLNAWLQQYVHPNPKNVPLATQSRHPLKVGQVEMREVKGEEGTYELIVTIQPYFMLFSPPKEPIRLIVSVPGKRQ